MNIYNDNVNVSQNGWNKSAFFCYNHDFIVNLQNYGTKDIFIYLILITLFI